MPLVLIGGGFSFFLRGLLLPWGRRYPELNAHFDCCRHGGGDRLHGRGFTERTQLGLLANQPGWLAGDLRAVDRVHGEHPARPAVREEPRPRDLLSPPGAGPPVRGRGEAPP